MSEKKDQPYKPVSLKSSVWVELGEIAEEFSKEVGANISRAAAVEILMSKYKKAKEGAQNG